MNGAGTAHLAGWTRAVEIALGRLYGRYSFRKRVRGCRRRTMMCGSLDNRIGAEAIQLGLDGFSRFLPHIVRMISTSQFFRRCAISDPKTQGLVKVTFNAQTGEIATANTGD